MSGLLEGKVALVTGGSSGIGRATALALGRAGARVVVAARREQEGEETAGMVRAEGGEALFVRADVSRAGEVEAMVVRTVEAYGRLDCAFNNAGIVRRPSLTAECPEEVWDQIIEVNLKGVWLCMKYEIPEMLRGGGGAIVNNASVAGLAGLQNFSAYTASKHGVVGLTRAAALEYAKAGLRVNAVCPGYVETPLNEKALQDPEFRARVLAREPVGRVGDAKEVAEAVVWLCSDAASFVTGHAMAVDGGYMAQ
jgi:NAD(P)-dependent dehydrogenase (short-subunit alcohol dehydrogenase family)